MGFGHDEYHPAEDGLIPCWCSLYIRAHVARNVLQGSGNVGVGRVRSDWFGVIYGTTQSDIAVQDTKRWAARCKLGCRAMASQ
jgi:hypothetical protein